jgi:ClpP class serine protease
VNDIEQEVQRALNDPAVAIIAQDIDSPGGESCAGNKLFDHDGGGEPEEAADVVVW